MALHAGNMLKGTADLLVGIAAIARYLGVHDVTVQRWRRWHGFPAAPLPNGQIGTTRRLIDMWVAKRAELACADASATNPMAYSRSRRDGAPTASEGHSPQPPKPSKARRNGASKALW